MRYGDFATVIVLIWIHLPVHIELLLHKDIYGLYAMFMHAQHCARNQMSIPQS